MSKPRIVFVGSTGFSHRCFVRLLQRDDTEVVGLITNPETFPISYRPEGVRNVLYADLKPTARAARVPIWEMAGGMNDPALLAQVAEWRPDMLLVVGWYHMVPRALRALAPAAGMHASLLPDYSGGAPLVWAIINGESRTGITLFWFGDGVDDGPIIGQAEVPILFEDTIATVYQRVEDAGVDLLERYAPLLARGECPGTPQDERLRRRMPQRSPADGRIDWSAGASRVYDFVRAQTRPYPGAFTTLNGRPLTIWRARPVSGVGENTGTARVSADEHLSVVCGDGRLLGIEEVGFDGETLSGPDLVRRVGITTGMRVGTDTTDAGQVSSLG